MQELVLVNGERVAAAGGATFERRDPFTGGVASVSAAAAAEDAVAAADNAAGAFRPWSGSPHRERRRLLMAASAVMEARADFFTGLMTAEIGATAAWSRFNVSMASAMLQEAAAQVYNVRGETIPSDVPGATAIALRVPAGVVLSIAPWNAPLVLAVRAVAFPVAYGNTVVLKASELSPATRLALGSVFAEEGFPPGVVNVISCNRAQAPEVSEALIAHGAVQLVNFTGSAPVGRIIGEFSGRHLKPSLLELDGKNPLIVLDDADLDYAARAAAFGAFANNGQACMAANRIIVQRSVGDAFVERLCAQAAALWTGDPRDPRTQIGPLADPAAPGRLGASPGRGRPERRASLAVGGTSSGAVFEPTVLAGVGADMKVYHEEIFGPVAPVTFVDSVEEAVAMANDTAFGLSAGVLTGDYDKGLAIAASLRTGMAHVNDQPVNDEPHAPFGAWVTRGTGASAQRPRSMSSPSCAGPRCSVSRASSTCEPPTRNRLRRTGHDLHRPARAIPAGARDPRPAGGVRLRAPALRRAARGGRAVPGGAARARQPVPADHGTGPLDRWVRDAVFAVSSAERGNAYLADALAGEAVRHGADADWIRGLRAPGAGSPGPGDSVGALIRFSRKMALEPYKSVPGDVGSLHAAGWADEDLVEVLSVVSLSAYMDILSLSLRIGQQADPAGTDEQGGN